MNKQTQPDPTAMLAATEHALWTPEDHCRRVELADIFSRPAPFEIDFGCGDGSFLLAMATRFPERNFLGTERMLGRVEKVCRAIARNRLENCRVLRLESFYSAKWLLPVGCASVVHIGFTIRGRSGIITHDGCSRMNS